MSTNYVQTALFVLNRPEPIRQASLLMVLASGVGSNSALMDGLRAHADESGSPWADQVISLRALLERGLPLSAALTGVHGLLPERTRTAIRIAEDSGTMREVLLDEATRLSSMGQQSQSIGFDPANTLLWFVIVGNIMASLLCFLMIYIIPKFKRIFEDFDVELPPLTVSLIDASDFLSNYWYLFLLPVMSSIVGGTVAIVWVTIQKTRYGHLVGSEHWPRYWVPDLLRYLCFSSVAGLPFGNVLETLQQQMRPGRAVRTVSTLRHRVESGTDILEGMAAVRLITTREQAFLEAANRSGHLDWGLLHLGRAIERAQFRWVTMIAQCFQPLMIIGVGAVVLYVVVALFMPLIGLTEELSHW